jgi:glycine dehydrogenase
MAGLSVVVVACDDHGNIDVADLRTKAAAAGDTLAAAMVTYPSTHGVFEEAIREICAAVHAALRSKRQAARQMRNPRTA